eukprot:XP_016656604.1 PREDICTED: uncharacterized protein LOC107882568 [Acyrthosiphon pisum]
MIVRHPLYHHRRLPYTKVRQSTINRRRVRPVIHTRYIRIEQNLRVTHVRRPGRDEKNTNNNKIIISGATPGQQVYRWRVPTTGSRQERLEKKKGPGGECPEKGHHTAALPPIIPSGLRSILISSSCYLKNIQELLKQTIGSCSIFGLE